MGQLTEQYCGLLAADGAGAEVDALVKDAQEDIAQIEEQLTSIYIDAKASRISEALDECVASLLLMTWDDMNLMTHCIHAFCARS